MTPRADDYAKRISYELPGDGKLRRFIVARFDLDSGIVKRCCITYEIILPGQRQAAIVRYDDAHDGFHRHRPGYPSPHAERIFLAHVVPNSRIRYAIEEIKTQHLEWEAEALESQEEAENDD